MPVHSCEENGKPGKQWGSGTCYTYTPGDKESEKRATEKAEKQGRAAYAHGYKGTERINFKATIDKFNASNDNSEYVEIELVACKGDFFLQNEFISDAVLKASAEKWSGTIHDISHMATDYPNGLAGDGENIEYVIGYNKLKSYDSVTKELRITSYIRKNSPKFNAWENYIAICKASNKIPNVSISAIAGRKLINASEIPSGVEIPNNLKGYSKFIAIGDLIPLGITTCLKGKCNDVDGCGITLKSNNTCNDDSCNFDNATIVESGKKEKELIKIKESLKRLKGEN